MRVRAAAVLLLAGALAGCARAPRPAPSPAPPLRVAVVSDLNGPYGSTAYGPEVAAAVRLIRERWRPDLVIAAGDLVAGQRPTLPDSVVRTMWGAFDSAVAAPLRAAGIPLVVTVGNHDASGYPAHARDRALAAEHWRDPARRPPLPLVDGAAFPFRYSLRAGDVFVAVWDATTQESSREPALRRWLRDALRSPAARAARHRVVVGHLPLYAVAEGRDRPGELLADGDRFRRELERWGATLYVSGHHHAYYPGRRGALELLHAGALGGGPRPLLGSEVPAPRSVTLLTFHADSVRHESLALLGAAARPILQDSLPPALCGRTGWVHRRDLPPPPAPPCPAPSPR